MLLYPSINTLRDKTDSRYSLVILTAKRARDIVDGKPALTEEESERPVSQAAKEIAEIEKFGYGFSDEIDGERDFDTILRQDREALEQMGIEGPFILCPHSLSGFEAILWAQKYPEEVEAIVGLDMSSANYEGLAEMKEGFAQNFAITLNKIVRFSGINRFFMSISEHDETYTDDEWRQYTALVCRNQANDTVCRENDAIGDVIEEINATELPSTPTLQFVSTYNSNYEYWKSTHQELVDAATFGILIELDCDHYVHQFESQRIADEMRSFIEALDT